jgi:serine/threonine-protein kinase
MSQTCARCHFENPDDTTFCGKCAAPLKERPGAEDSATRTLDLSGEGFTTGAVIAGRYEIIECLGEGGMGKVYKAHDLDVHEDIALKLIRPEIAANPRIIQRFQNELKLTRKIAHRNVCRMFDLGKEGSARFITMEYVPGEDLKSTIRRIGPLTVRKAISIGKQICQGLSEAHGLGVIHRDLKPSNIMVDREGNVRIMDFGIALSRETEGITDAGAIVGTIQYLAPEVLMGGKPGPASDIYSLGVILYEMTTGQTPFGGDASPPVVSRYLKETPKDPGVLNPEVPAAMSRLILKCLAKDPATRFEKAQELCASLARIEEEFPTTTEGSKLSNLWESIQLRTPLRKALMIGLPLAAVAIVIAILIGHGRGRDGTATIPPWKNSIVVLPFKHLNPGPGQEYLWPTVTDTMIRNLEKTRELKVINYQTALQYRDASVSDSDIAKKLNVENALQGTITSKEGGLDVRVELRDLRREAVLFSRVYPAGSEKEVYGVLDEISRTVAEELGVGPGQGPGLEPKSRSSTDPEAQRHYRYGLHFQDEYLRTDVDTNFASSVDNYRKAVAIDPRFALVYWRLGMIYEIKFNRDRQAGDLDKMSEYLSKAYDQDPDLAEANLGMGWVYFNREDHDRAFRFFRRAYELDVNNAEVNYHIGSFLRSLGLFDQARTHYMRALALDPYPGDFAEWHRVLADCNSQLGQVKEAAEVLKKAMEGNPDYHLSLDYAVCLIKLGNYAEAGRRIEEVRRQAGELERTRRHEALLLAFLGKNDAAVELMKNEENKANQLTVSVYSVLGLKDKAIGGIKLAEEGFQRYRWYPYSYLVLKNNPFFDSLRAEPAFRAIYEKERRLFEERLKKFGGL